MPLKIKAIHKETGQEYDIVLRYASDDHVEAVATANNLDYAFPAYRHIVVDAKEEVEE